MSVVLPVATKVTQSGSINRFAKEISHGRILSFGGLHPLQSDALDVLERLHEEGFVGIKLHPEFQQCRIDSPESIRLLRRAEELKMLTVIHAGVDPSTPPPVRCSPRQLRNVLGYVSGRYIVAAHLGGFMMWDEAEEYLCGTELYFDTASVSRLISPEQYFRIIRSHGADRVLFGSDCPWENPADTLKALGSLGLTDAELGMICGGNAERLLFGAGER